MSILVFQSICKFHLFLLFNVHCTGVKFIGSKVMCVFCFVICTPEGRGGEQGGRTNFKTKHTKPLTQEIPSALYLISCEAEGIMRAANCPRHDGRRVGVTGRLLRGSVLRSESWRGGPPRGIHLMQYRAEGISWAKGSVSFVLKFAPPPFPPPLPSGVQISKQNMP